MGLGMGDGLWTEIEPSQFAHEREALDFVRRRLPDREPWRAWSNFTFVDTNGRPSEVDLSAAIARAMEQAGIRQSERYRTVGHYKLVELLDEGATWQDYKAAHQASRVDKRIRIHLRSRAADEAEKASIDRAAEREFRLLAQLDHPGIDKPDDLVPTPGAWRRSTPRPRRGPPGPLGPRPPRHRPGHPPAGHPRDRRSGRLRPRARPGRTGRSLPATSGSPTPRASQPPACAAGRP